MFKTAYFGLCVALVILSVVQVHCKDQQDEFESKENSPVPHSPESVKNNNQHGKDEKDKSESDKNVPITHSPETVTTTDQHGKDHKDTSKSDTKLPSALPETTTIVDTTPKPTPPHCNAGERRAVEHSCKDYLECDRTFKWVNKKCSVMCQVFEPKSSKCVWNWNFPCMKAPTTVPTQTPNPSTPTPGVPTKAPVCTDGSKKNVTPKDCKHYLVCQSGQWVRTSCSFGYDFDSSKNDCVWSWWAKC